MANAVTVDTHNRKVTYQYNNRHLNNEKKETNPNGTTGRER